MKSLVHLGLALGVSIVSLALSQIFMIEDNSVKTTPTDFGWIEVEPNLVVSAYEVSNKQFMKFRMATNYITQAEKQGDSFCVFDRNRPPSLRITKGVNWFTPCPGAPRLSPEHPVTHLSIYDMMAYADWAGVRLLTSDEWEKLEGGERTRNLWKPGAHAVGVRTGEPNEKGFYHLHGNVWEATITRHPEGFRGRGGSYLCHVFWCAGWERRSSEGFVDPNEHVGFRVAKKL